MRRCEEIEVMNLTAREQIHRLVDALPDDALDTVKRVLAGLSEPTESAVSTSPAAVRRFVQTTSTPQHHSSVS